MANIYSTKSIFGIYSLTPFSISIPAARLASSPFMEKAERELSGGHSASLFSSASCRSLTYPACLRRQGAIVPLLHALAHLFRLEAGRRAGGCRKTTLCTVLLTCCLLYVTDITRLWLLLGKHGGERCHALLPYDHLRSARRRGRCWRTPVRTVVCIPSSRDLAFTLSSVSRLYYLLAQACACRVPGVACFSSMGSSAVAARRHINSSPVYSMQQLWQHF